jgi:hypothetical protein
MWAAMPVLASLAGREVHAKSGLLDTEEISSRKQTSTQTASESLAIALRQGGCYHHGGSAVVVEMSDGDRFWVSGDWESN